MKIALHPRLHKALSILDDVAGFLWMLALILGLPYLVFTGFDAVLQTWGLTVSWRESAGAWWAVGAVCAAYWPWRFRKQLKGQWLSNLPGFIGLSLTGPLALILGYPI